MTESFHPPSPADGSPDVRTLVWVDFLRTHGRLLRTLSDELDQEGQVPLGTLDVLMQLAEAGGRLRVRDLLQRLVLSQPGLSRRVERMESEGLVRRLPDPADRRGVVVEITGLGRRRFHDACSVHVPGIDRVFGSLLEDDEAEVMLRVFRRILTALGETVAPEPDQPSVTPTATSAMAAATAR